MEDLNAFAMLLVGDILMLILCMVQQQSRPKGVVGQVFFDGMFAAAHMPLELLVRTGRQLVRLDMLIVCLLVQLALTPAWLLQQLQGGFKGRLDGLWRELLDVRELDARLREQRHRASEKWTSSTV